MRKGPVRLREPRNAKSPHRSQKSSEGKVTKIGEWGICKRNPNSSPRVEDLGQVENGYESNEELELGNLLTTVSRGAGGALG